MGFSSSRYDRKPVDQKRWKVHPIWRGIGCILLILIPIFSFFFARYYIANINLFPLPPGLMKPVIFSYYSIGPIDSILFGINNFLGGALLYGDIFFTVIFSILGFGILSIIYSVFYRFLGPPRYGPLDAPEQKKGRSTY